MDFLQEKVKELTETELSDEIKQALDNTDKEFGTVEQTKETVLNSRIEKVERIRIKPANPIVAPGALLGSATQIPEEDLFKMAGTLGGVSLDDEYSEVKLHLSYPKTHSIDSLFEFTRCLNKTLLVVGDYVEITKTTVASSGVDANTNCTKKTTKYEVGHYIDVLDSDKMYRIPTKIFEDEDVHHSLSSRSTQIFTAAEFDLKAVMARYNKSKLEEVVHPLKLVS